MPPPSAARRSELGTPSSGIVRRSEEKDRKDATMSPSRPEETGESAAPPSSSGVQAPPTSSSRVLVDLAAQSHQGLVRGNNEDHYLVVRFERALETLLTNLPEGSIPNRSAEIGYGMLVADGMGGRAAGELASQMAISALVNLVLHTPDWILRLGEQEIEVVLQRMTQR